MEKPQEFYIIYFVDKDCDVNGIHLERGYYRFNYDLTGVEFPDPCKYSKDRYEWSTCDLFKDLGKFQEFFNSFDVKPMKMEREEYIETITYRGVSVPIFCDDYGQCFYCIFDNEVISFGSFKAEYEEEVKALIDSKLDRQKTVLLNKQIGEILGAAEYANHMCIDERIRTGFCYNTHCNNCMVCTKIPEGGWTYGDCRKAALKNAVEMAKKNGIQVTKWVEDIISKEKL